MSLDNLICACGHLRLDHDPSKVMGIRGRDRCRSCSCSRFRLNLSRTGLVTDKSVTIHGHWSIPNGSRATDIGVCQDGNSRKIRLDHKSSEPDAYWCVEPDCVRYLEPAVEERGTADSESLRTSLLNEANDLVMGDRNNSYGEPHQDFARSAGALNSFGYRGPDGRDMQAHDIAIIIGVVKMSRIMWSPRKRDSWVDIAGYAACGYEAAEKTLE